MEIFVCFPGKATLRVVCWASVESWNLEGDIYRIERVQMRATRIPFGFEKLDYERRLKILRLTKLKDRRLVGDLIEMFKVMSS